MSLPGHLLTSVVSIITRPGPTGRLSRSFFFFPPSCTYPTKNIYSACSWNPALFRDKPNPMISTRLFQKSRSFGFGERHPPPARCKWAPSCVEDERCRSLHPFVSRIHFRPWEGGRRRRRNEIEHRDYFQVWSRRMIHLCVPLCLDLFVFHTICAQDRASSASSLAISLLPPSP